MVFAGVEILKDFPQKSHLSEVFFENFLFLNLKNSFFFLFYHGTIFSLFICGIYDHTTTKTPKKITFSENELFDKSPDARRC